jgi:Spy/CpxP family protein refolding chaperone
MTSPDLLTRHAPRSYWMSPKLSGIILMLLVFLCGAVAGAVAMNLGHHRLHARPFWEESAKAEYLKTVKRELNLSPEQTTQMATILDDFAKYYQTVLSEGKWRIMNILNAEQKAKFQKMLKDRPDR